MTARALAATRPLVGTVLPFALPIGLSAFLLFSVQPLIGRLVLPIFGGAPAVWATMLFFFQATLLVGYLYGHLSVTRLGPAGPIVHLILASLGLLALIVAPSEIAGLRDEAAAPVLDLIRILFLIIGLPALVLTTTTPLVSGWFEVARARHEADPYWLYALSNGGSLLALIAYPLVIEPRLGLGDQRAIWAIGYALLVVALAVAAMRVMPLLRGRAAATSQDAVRAAATSRDLLAAGIGWRRRARWVLLAAVPSGLLSAVTTFVATDLMSAPLLWVIPLAIYLVSFVIAFSPRGGALIRMAMTAAPAMLTLLWVPYGSAGGWPVLAIVAMEFTAFGIVATALHGRLALDRPHPSQLTEFYLVMSAGGALASAFVALVAPLVFPGVWEYPILLVAGLVALALVAPTPVIAPQGPGRGLDFRPFFAGVQGRFLPYLGAAALLSVALVLSGALAAEAAARWLLVGGLILLVGARPWFLTIATAFVLALATFVLQPSVDFRARSFFGVTEVLPSPDGKLTLLMNGTTVHGSQSTDPAKRRDAQSYYVSNGPVGDLFQIVATRSEGRSSAVAVAGLGGGAIAAYIDPKMTMTFFEIDPVVIAVATDGRYFTYIDDAPVAPVVVEGDARLSLVDVPDASYDLLLMDAFNSDSPPVHLFTAEAIADELRVTREDGLLAFHISNRYYDLAPPIAAAVTAAGLTVLEKSHDPGPVPEPGETPSRWLAASSDPDTLAALEAAGWRPTTAADRPFTDDYADLLRYLLIGN